MEKPDSFGVKHIEKYLNGHLEADELNEFELQIKNNPSLAKKVEHLKKMPNDLLLIEKDRLSQQIKNWIEMEKEDSQNPSELAKSLEKDHTKTIRVAFLIILIIGAIIWGVWQLYSSERTSTKSQYFIAQHYHNPVVLRGQFDKRWQLAIEAYSSGDFSNMVRQMHPWIDEDNITSEQLFYFALANLYTNPIKYETALDYFSRTEKQDPSTFRKEIIWFRALIFIQQKDYDKAKAELTKIESNSQYKSDVAQLLEEME